MALHLYNQHTPGLNNPRIIESGPGATEPLPGANAIDRYFPNGNEALIAYLREISPLNVDLTFHHDYDPHSQGVTAAQDVSLS